MRLFFALLSLLLTGCILALLFGGGLRLLAGCIPALLFGGSLLVTFVGIWALWIEFRISKYGLIVPGEVIAIDARQKRTRRGWATVYDALVRFQMLEGADPVTFVVTTGSFQVYQIHQRVRVIYLPGDLRSARIVAPIRWVGPWFVIGFGLIFAATTLISSLSLINIHH